MPKKGHILEDPNTGNTYEVMETAESTNGERTVFKMTLKSRGKLVPDHSHSLQEEQYEVISGRLTILLNGKEQILTAGQNITLPKNQPHNHYNNDNEPVSVVQTVMPALDFDYLMENLIGLAKDGKMPNGKAGLVQELVTLRYIDSKSFLATIPIGIQRLLMNIVGPVGRLFGYRAIYKKYSGIEK